MAIISSKAPATPFEVRIHGTYPYDEVTPDKEFVWKRIRAISHQEAARLAKIPEEVQKHKSMWFNKGFIVIEGDFPSREFRTFDFQKGMKAIYLHDETYTLIERMY